jgi:hypothetical protein
MEIGAETLGVDSDIKHAASTGMDPGPLWPKVLAAGWWGTMCRPESETTVKTTKKFCRPISSKTAHALVIGMAMLAASACSDQDSSGARSPPAKPSEASPVIVRGEVTDANTAAPVVGAAVEWSYGSRRLLGSTDANGRYAFAVPAPKDGGAKDFTIAVSTWSNLHEAMRHDVRINSGEVTTVNFVVGAKSSAQIGSVRGRVTDAATGQAVSEVVVSIIGAGGDLTTTTQADGSYEFPRIGLGRMLVIRAITKEPPCFAPTERSFDMVRPVVTQDFPLGRVFTSSLHCSTDVGATRGRVP